METMLNCPVTTWAKVGAATAGAIAALAIGKNDGGYSVFLGTKVGLFRSSGVDGTSFTHWERLTHAPIGVMALAVSPNFATDRTIIAGAEAGIYVSHDGGDTWRAAQHPSSSSMVLTICFSPNYAEDGVIMAGTLEDGVCYSNTRGDHWVAKNFGLLDATVFALATSPNFAQDETVYAGTDSAIYYSYNNARAWKHLNFPESATPILSLTLSPDFQSDQTLYVGTEKQGLFRSVDHGEHWENLNFPATSVSSLHVSRAGHLLAATDAGIFQSLDRGQTWACLAGLPDVISLVTEDELVIAGLADQGAWLTTDLTDWQPLSIPPIRSLHGFALAPDFENDPIAFMYGLQEGIWKTDDGGVSWGSVNDTLPTLDINALVVSPEFRQNHTVVASSPEGVWVSHDAGEHWQITTGDAASLVTFSPNGALLGAAFPHDGIRVSEDMGQTWRNVPGPWDAGGKVMALSMTDQERFHVALLEGVNDVLTLWQGKPGQFESVLQQTAGPNPVVSFWVPAGENDAWYAGLGDKVWRFDAHASASLVESNIGADSTQPEDIRALMGLPSSNGQTLYACTGRRLYASGGASSWHVVHDFEDDVVLSATLSPNHSSSQVVYALLLGGTFWRGVILM
jgi:photosystem II stability/assembly factor-like uncharacterized protein